MAYKENPTVEKLHRYLPFDPSHDQIYEEYQLGDSIAIHTRALEYLEQVLGVTDTRIIILTGDAGHGKTHLCRRIVREYLGYDAESTYEIIQNRCDGRQLPSVKHPAKRNLRIFKDFSEVSVEMGRNLLADTLEDAGSVSIFCVNEGRLRSILNGSTEANLVALNSAFDDSFNSGLASMDGQLHIVNLNYQSVATPENSILERVFSGEGARPGWLDDTNWAECGSCDAVSHCPIRRNVALLGGLDGQVRRERIREVMAIMERLGTVITIREIVMTVAYLLTGGLRCKDVHNLHEESEREGAWQHEYMYYNLLFSPPATLGEDKLARIPLLKELRKVDPGLIADRGVDDKLINNRDTFPDSSFELLFRGQLGRRNVVIDARHGIDDILADASSREERQAEETFTRMVIRALRRRDFFDADDLDANRLGINYYEDFRWLLTGEGDNNRRVRIKNHLIAGLHTLQGLRLPRGDVGLLHLVDPAFGRSTNHAAIIAKKISPVNIKLVPESEGWGAKEGARSYPLRQAVDWIDRVVLLTVDSGVELSKYRIDLLTFDCIMRAESGYLPATFYAHDIRRVTNFLGLIAEAGGQSGHDQIDVMIGGRMHSVILEEDDVISIGGVLI